jgi:putative transposase
MARAWRIEYEGAYYHLLSHGNEGRDIFLCYEDCRLVLDTVGEWGERFAIDLFPYVLMPNHYYLLLKARRANLSRAMQWFAGTCMRRFNNRTYSTVSHIVTEIKKKMRTVKELRTLTRQLNSQFRL